MRTIIRVLIITACLLVVAIFLCGGAPPVDSAPSSAAVPAFLALEIYYLELPDNLRLTLDAAGRLEIVEFSIRAVSRTGTTSVSPEETASLLSASADVSSPGDESKQIVEGDVYTLTVKSDSGFTVISSPAAHAPAALTALVGRLLALAAEVELPVNGDCFIMSQPAAVAYDRTSPRAGIVSLHPTDLDSDLRASLNHCASHRAILHRISRQAFDDLVRRVHTYEFLYRVDSAAAVQIRLWPPEK